MRVRLVTSLRQFDALAAVWRDLTEQSGQTCPLLSHDWFACSWRAAGPECRRELLVVEDAAGPAAFIPLAHSRTRIGGLPVRRVGLLAPDDAPFVDVPIAGAVDEVLAAFIAELKGRRDWDVMSLLRLPTHSLTYKGIEGALAGQFSWRIARRERSPYLSIAGSWDEFVRRLSASARAECRGLEAQLHESDALSLEEHREVHTDGRAFTDAMEVFWAGWTGLHGEGFGIAQSLPRFFRELTQRASANGWLRLWILRVNGRAVATEYQLGSSGTLHAVRRDHDGGVREVAPHRVLNFGIIRALFEQGHALEYGLGPSSPSVDWASGVHETLGLDVYAPTAYGRVLHGLETRVLPAARRWRRQQGA